MPLYHVDRVVRETGRVIDNGFEDLRRAATDTAYQTQLLNELFPKKTT